MYEDDIPDYSSSSEEEVCANPPTPKIVDDHEDDEPITPTTTTKITEPMVIERNEFDEDAFMALSEAEKKLMLFDMEQKERVLLYQLYYKDIKVLKEKILLRDEQFDHVSRKRSLLTKENELLKEKLDATERDLKRARSPSPMRRGRSYSTSSSSSSRSPSRSRGRRRRSPSSSSSRSPSPSKKRSPTPQKEPELKFTITGTDNAPDANRRQQQQQQPYVPLNIDLRKDAPRQPVRDIHENRPRYDWNSFPPYNNNNFNWNQGGGEEYDFDQFPKRGGGGDFNNNNNNNNGSRRRSPPRRRPTYYPAPKGRNGKMRK